MPKALTIIGLVISVLVFLLFLADLVSTFPFKRASMTMDVAFVVCAAILGYLSWATFKEQG